MRVTPHRETVDETVTFRRMKATTIVNSLSLAGRIAGADAVALRKIKASPLCRELAELLGIRALGLKKG